jgi:hypothetical protein
MLRLGETAKAAGQVEIANSQMRHSCRKLNCLETMEGNVTGLSYTLIGNGKLDESLGDCGLPEDFSRNGLPTSSATKSTEPSSGEYASL